MSASFYIEQEARVLAECRAMRKAHWYFLEIASKHESFSAIQREAARRELLRRKLWGIK